MLSAGAGSRPPPAESPAPPPPPARASSCQICLDDIDGASLLRLLCGPACTAAVCRQCLEHHIRTRLATTFPTILPRVWCPACRVPLPKSAWRLHVASDAVELYAEQCERACSFLTACCGNDFYTHLPEPPTAALPALEEVLPPEMHAALPLLRTDLALFVQHQISAHQAVESVDTVLGGVAELSETTRERAVDKILPRVRDDERRAALLLAYHAVHKRVTTWCCYATMCFVCKRRWDDVHELDPYGACDQVPLEMENVVQCRACRLMLVKVDGCDSVGCVCGSVLDWSEELHMRRGESGEAAAAAVVRPKRP